MNFEDIFITDSDEPTRPNTFLIGVQPELLPQLLSVMERLGGQAQQSEVKNTLAELRGVSAEQFTLLLRLAVITGMIDCTFTATHPDDNWWKLTERGAQR
jgi:hypothetical protein